MYEKIVFFLHYSNEDFGQDVLPCFLLFMYSNSIVYNYDLWLHVEFNSQLNHCKLHKYLQLLNNCFNFLGIFKINYQTDNIFNTLYLLNAFFPHLFLGWNITWTLLDKIRRGDLFEVVHTLCVCGEEGTPFNHSFPSAQIFKLI